MKTGISSITERGKTLLLAYDHGMEHGPSDFKDKTANPSYILEIARKGRFNGIIFQKGVAEKYYEKESKVPLIVKLNGKTNIRKGEPVSRQICSVQEALDMGAKAVGYTIYVGSEYETDMFKEFGAIEEEAHDNGMPVIAWLYPRGRAVKRLTPKLISYAARVGLELGADFAKVKYTGSPETFRDVVKSAGRCRVLSLGGAATSDRKFLEIAKGSMDAGASGMAVGRNIWQHKDPIGISKALREVIFKRKTVAQAMKVMG
ncbi:MAG: hypothetical protein DRO99_03220 [Candidatus Aenigmatarchaeota archaeon]|nr:MAG: hypothetical protein DRO99_03220 [Candidatus Aenigmarchaeota archaeon]